MTTKNDINYSTALHLSTFMGYVFPLGNIIAPFVLWTAKKGESPFIDAHGKSAINFQLSLLFYGMLLAICIVPITILTLGLGLIAIALAFIPYLIFKFSVIIQASLSANEGHHYQYPFVIHFIK